MNVSKPALQYGTQIKDSFEAFRAGMDPEEFAGMQAQYRQQIGAAGISLDEFQNTVIEGSGVLTAYTGDLASSVKMQADAFALARTYGVQGQAATQQFINSQKNLFKEFNTVFSMTSEEFIQMNEQIRSSAAVQERIYRLNRQQRQLYVEQYQQTVRQLKINGLSQESAMAAADAMAALGAESPKERLKKSAKLQAVGGALGFGGEAARAAEMMRRGDTATPEFAELMKTMEQRTGSVMGQGFGSEMMVSQMLETTGLQGMLGPKSEFAKLNTRQYDAIKDLDKSATKRNELAGKSLAVMQEMYALMTGPIGQGIGSIAAAAGVIASGMAARGALKGLAGMSGPDALKKGMGQLIKSQATTFGKLAAGSLAAGAVAAAGMIGWEIGSMISDGIEEHFPDVNDWIGEGMARIASFFGSDTAAEALASNKQKEMADIKRAAAPRERKEKRQEIQKMIDHLRESQKKVQESDRDKAADEAKAFDTLIKVQEDQLAKLDVMIQLDKKTTEAVTTQTEKQEQQHDEAMKKSSAKSNRLIWTPVAG